MDGDGKWYKSFHESVGGSSIAEWQTIRAGARVRPRDSLSNVESDHGHSGRALPVLPYYRGLLQSYPLQPGCRVPTLIRWTRGARRGSSSLSTEA
eukprot:164787-Amorphochlora_amoeboformis.AAC.2